MPVFIVFGVLAVVVIALAIWFARWTLNRKNKVKPHFVIEARQPT